MMQPLNSLGSVVAQVGRSVGRRRNFSSSPDSSRNVKRVVGEFASRGIPFYLGYGLAGPIVFGDKVALLEEQRQKEWTEMYEEAAVAEIGDVRDIAVTGLGETVYCYLKGDASGLGEVVYSYLKGNAVRWWSGGRKS